MYRSNASAQRRRRARSCVLAAGVAVVALTAAAPASAAVDCEANALRGSVLGSGLAPFTANGPGATCASDTAALGPITLPALLQVRALHAETQLQGNAAAPVGRSSAGLAEAHVGGLLPAGLLPNLPVDGIIPLDLGLLGTLPVDITPALRDLLEPIDATRLLDVGAVHSTAEVSCVAGQPRFTGSSAIAALALGGRDLPVDEPLTETVALVDTQHIDPSDIDLSKVVLPLGVDLGVVTPVLEPVLDSLPDIEVPATLAHVKLTPKQHMVEGSRHTWRALRAQISVAGVPVADLSIGEASVSATRADCAGGGPNPGPSGDDADGGPRGGRGGPSGPGMADAALACTSRKIVLTDVAAGSGRVSLQGVAHRSFAGRRVAIRLLANRAVVARPVVSSDGRFSATAKLPPRSIRYTNKARYVASIGRQRSLGLKLMRRMAVDSTTINRGRLTIKGRVIRPYAAAAQPIVVHRRLACGEWERVERARPSSSGRFTVTLKAPASGTVAVYRMRTKVTWRSDPDRLTRTYTLPRYVEG